MNNWLPGDIRDRIRDLCRANNLKQSELAYAIRIDKSTLSRFRSGKTDKLSDSSLPKIAQHFNASTDFLLGITNISDRKHYDIGESMTDIVDSLNARGIRTAKGLPFRIGSLGTVLKNRKYIGEYRYGRIVIPDKLPVLIDPEQFDRVQRRMEVNRHAPARAKADEEYLLTTKLFCGHCGRMLAGESGRSRNGEVYHYYKCGGAKRKQGCTLKAVQKRWIERTVVTATIARALQDEAINHIADTLIAYLDQESTLLPSLKQQLRGCEKSIQNMLNAIEAGIITPSTKQRLQDLETCREELNVSILQEQLQKPRFTKEQIVTWISRFKYGDPDDLEYQKEIIDNFVNSVYVYDDRLVMTYNYKDGTETISLDAVHQAFGSDLSSDAPLNRKLWFPVFVFSPTKEGI